MSSGARPALASRALAAAALLAGALLLLWLVALPTLAALTALPGNPWLAKVQEGEPIGLEGIETLRSSRLRALSIVDEARSRSDLALADLLEAELPETAASRAEALTTAAIGNLEASLTLAPSSAFVWTRLAHARLRSATDDPTAVSALALALRTAPYASRLRLPRIEAGFLAWPRLSDDLRAELRIQIRLAAGNRHHRAILVQMARRHGRLDTLRLSLVADLRLLWRTERLIRQELAKPAAN